MSRAASQQIAPGGELICRLQFAVIARADSLGASLLSTNDGGSADLLLLPRTDISTDAACS
jgi:hypothetical protein